MQNSQVLSEKINTAIEILLSDPKKEKVSSFLTPILLDLEKITQDTIKNVLDIIKTDNTLNVSEKLLFVQLLLLKNLDEKLKEELDRYLQILNFIKTYSNAGINDVINLLNKTLNQNSQEVSKAVVEDILTILRVDDEKFTDSIKLELVTILVKLEGGKGVNPTLDEYKDVIEKTIKKEKFFSALLTINAQLNDVRTQLDQQRKENDPEIPGSNRELLIYLVNNSKNIGGAAKLIDSFYEEYCRAAYKVLELSKILSEKDKNDYLNLLSELCFNPKTFKSIYIYIWNTMPEDAINLIPKLNTVYDFLDSISFVLENEYTSGQLSQVIHMFYSRLLINPSLIDNPITKDIDTTLIKGIFKSPLLEPGHIELIKNYLKKAQDLPKDSTNASTQKSLQRIIEELEGGIMSAERKLDLSESYEDFISKGRDQTKQIKMG